MKKVAERYSSAKGATSEKKDSEEVERQHRELEAQLRKQLDGAKQATESLAEEAAAAIEAEHRMRHRAGVSVLVGAMRRWQGVTMSRCVLGWRQHVLLEATLSIQEATHQRVSCVSAAEKEISAADMYKAYVSTHAGTGVSAAPEREFVTSEQLNEAAAEHGGEVFDQAANRQAAQGAAAKPERKAQLPISGDDTGTHKRCKPSQPRWMLEAREALQASAEGSGSKHTEKEGEEEVLRKQPECESNDMELIAQRLAEAREMGCLKPGRRRKAGLKGMAIILALG